MRKQWFLLDIIVNHPSISAHVSRSPDLSSQSNCFLASTEFEKALLFSQGAGSAKNFLLFRRSLDLHELAQLRTGYSPSPFEDNGLAAYYFLDGTDVSYNQEKVFNQATSSWDAFLLDIPSS